MSTDGSFTWQEFQKDALEFLKISDKLQDTWALHHQHDQEGGSYLIYKQKVPFQEKLESAAETLLQLEYHIVYSISYQVPVLYFIAHKSDGTTFSLEEAWSIFRNPSSADAATRTDMLSILTQMEHPVLFKPYLALHPCRTAELLTQAGPSRNRVLTFISLMGPYVQLNLQNAYGLLETKSPSVDV